MVDRAGASGPEWRCSNWARRKRSDTARVQLPGPPRPLGWKIRLALGGFQRCRPSPRVEMARLRGLLDVLAPPPRCRPGPRVEMGQLLLDGLPLAARCRVGPRAELTPHGQLVGWTRAPTSSARPAEPPFSRSERWMVQPLLSS